MTDSSATGDSSLDAYIELQRQFQNGIAPNPKGPSSLLIRQLLLHQYSPKIAVISSELADQVTAAYNFTKFVDFLQYFEEELYGPGSLLTNKVHVKFIQPIDELLRTQLDLKNDRRNNLNSELFEMSELKPAGKDHSANYLQLVSRVSSSLTIAPFETFNHPISQLIVISAEDSLQTVKNLINDWKYVKYPKWIDLANMFAMFLIVVDSKNSDSLQQAIKLQEHLKLQLNYRSIIIVHQDSEKEFVDMKPRLGSLSPVRQVGVKFHQAVNNMIVDFINKYLIPYMERKMNHWNEDIVNPRRSFTGRLFNVSKRWGSSSSSLQDQSSSQNYNSAESFYYTTSNEFLIRKLADWFFMLKDYKKSYTTYELLKKDFLNDKSWNNLASLHEFMIISLLVGSSQKISMIGNGITTKIINDLVNPMVDSLQYSYLSRCYLRTYSLRSLLTIAELFISLSEANQQYKINNNNSIYFDESYNLFMRLIDMHLINEENEPTIMTRISYIYDIYYLDTRERPKAVTDAAVDAAETVEKNDYKSAYRRDDYEIIGLTRYRKSELWTYLSTQKQQAIDNLVI